MNYNPTFDALYGTITDVRNNGKLDESYCFRGKKRRYIQVWDAEERPLLVSGTGTKTESVNDGKRNLTLIYKDSILVSCYSIRKAENDTIYHKTDKIASPKEGFNAFTPKLAEAISYPILAQLVGKEGLVYISFFVEKNGKLSEIKPTTNEGFRMEAKALKQLAKLPPWHPATFQGRPVKSEYTLPIRYKLVD
ncbi:energy transducer TonB [Adhaeribacter soli]|nr:energy transducer TonB [Adhaeribacter soli]